MGNNQIRKNIATKFHNYVNAIHPLSFISKKLKWEKGMRLCLELWSTIQRKLGTTAY
nr:hypothetical protein [Ornithobacterium rhinotracheale]